MSQPIRRLLLALALSFAAPADVAAQSVILPPVRTPSGAIAPSEASVLIGADGAEKATPANPLRTSGAVAPSTAAATTSGVIAATGGTATVVLGANVRIEVINPSTATLWASFGAPAVNGPGSFKIAPDGSYVADHVAGTLTLLSTASGQAYTVNRFTF